MGADQVTDLMRHLLLKALVISAPVLLAAAVTSFLLSLFQTLTSLQDQTLSTVPRILVVVLLILAGLPWFLRQLVGYSVGLFLDFHRYLE